MTFAATTSRTRPQHDALQALTGRLRDDYGDRAVTAQAVREQHSHGEGLADAALPDVVVFPHTNDEVAAIVRCATRRASRSSPSA